MNKIKPQDMFSLPKGTKIKLKDGRTIELLSDYIRDGLKYEYVDCDSNETDYIVCLKLGGCEIIE